MQGGPVRGIAGAEAPGTVKGVAEPLQAPLGCAGISSERAATTRPADRRPSQPDPPVR